VLYADGNSKRISWVIQSTDSAIEQMREQADLYLDKVNDEQAKYIALHVGIFWGIGRFIIKNEDSVDVMLDSKSMYEHLTNNTEVLDPFILARRDFIKRLIAQRKLNVNYHLIESNKNSASKLL
jgi:hypothetical protein